MKIALLAMSGVRVFDPELMRLGLTLPGFEDRARTIASLPSLGLLWLAACTPPGHDVRYFEAESVGAEPAELFDADLVAINTFTAQAREAYAITDRLRARGVAVAIGGLHATVRPDEALAHANYVVVGEGEAVWPRLVAHAEREGARGSRVFDARDRGKFEAVDVGALPVPRYDLLDVARYNRFTVQTSRGCPWRCDFCASSVMLTDRYRKRPVDAIVRDIEAVRRLRPRPFIEFADDNTFVDLEWGKGLCEAIAPLGVRWFTETDLRVADDEELLRLMRRAGCREVLVGVESPSADDLHGVELRADFKAKRAATAGEAIARIQAHGIAVNACFILGLDHHGPDVFDRVAAAVDAWRPYDVQVTVLTPFPGTPLYNRLREEGRLTAPDAWEQYTLFDVVHTPKGMSALALRSGLHRLTAELYTRVAVRARREGFRRDILLRG